MSEVTENVEFKLPGRKRATVTLALGAYLNTAITLIQGLLMVPLYLHFLGANLYGLWLASGGMLGMLWMMNFGVGSIITQRIARAYGEKNLERAGSYFVNGMFVYLFICVAYGLAGWIVSLWIADILSLAGEEAELLRQCFLIAVLAMSMTILNECLRSFSQAMLRPLAPMLGMAMGRILGIGLTIWMLYGEFGLWSIPFGLLAAETVILIINSLQAYHLFGATAAVLRIEMDLIKEYVKASPALLLAKSGDSLSRESEPLLITLFINAETTAVYMIARRAADMVLLVISVLNGAIFGAFSHLVGEADDERIRQTVMQLGFLAFAASLVGYCTYVAANNAFLSLWVGPEYVYDQVLIAAIGIGFFSRALRGMLWQILYAVGDFTVTSLVVFAEAIVKIALVLLMLGAIGVAAVPYALAVSGLVSLAVLGQRLVSTLGIAVRYRAQIRMGLSVLACLFLATIFVIGDSWFSFAWTSAALVGSMSIAVAVINWPTCKSYLFKA